MPFDPREIYVTSDEVEARVLESALDEEEIECYVIVNPHGCTVMVDSPSDQNKARQVRRKVIGS